MARWECLGCYRKPERPGAELACPFPRRSDRYGFQARNPPEDPAEGYLLLTPLRQREIEDEEWKLAAYPCPPSSKLRCTVERWPCVVVGYFLRSTTVGVTEMGAIVGASLPLVSKSLHRLYSHVCHSPLWLPIELELPESYKLFAGPSGIVERQREIMAEGSKNSLYSFDDESEEREESDES